MLSATMQLKTWSAACKATGEFAARYAASQPAAVKYLTDNWFCAEWMHQWLAAGRRFAHSDHDTTCRSRNFTTC